MFKAWQTTLNYTRLKAEVKRNAIGGLVMNRFGRLPRRGEVISIDRFRFKILNADSRRIHLLQVTERRGAGVHDKAAAGGEQ